MVREYPVVIFVVSCSKDEHAVVVMSALGDLGAPYTLFDLSQFPRHMGLALSYRAGKQRDFALRQPDGTRLDLTDCGAIWWRRPQPFVPDPAITRDSHYNFALNESYEAFAGLWLAVNVFWVNNPLRDEAAHRKVFQLRVAQEVGLPIPETLITNEPEEAREFIGRRGHDRTVYKSFSATEKEWRETRLLRREEIHLLHQVRHAPVIFQEYVETGYDLRVTVVGAEIFTAAIHSRETSYKVDFRMDIANARIEPVELPEETEGALHRLMRALGLVYGAIDMRKTPDGRHVFLEINPAGQWLFIENVTGQPITRCLAELLASEDRRRMM